MSSERPVILFDGVCNLCNRSVNFVIARDPDRRFALAALQSGIGRRLAAEHGLDATDLSTVILIEGGRAWTESSAALRIARRLRGPVRLLSIGLLLPRCVRDGIYRFVARRRHRWFGRTVTCRLPDDADRTRFLDT